MRTPSPLIPWLPRHPVAALTTTVGAALVVLVAPLSSTIEMGTGGNTVRLYALEYIPLILALLLALYFEPRMAPWEATGAQNVQRLAVLCTVLTATVPAAITGLVGPLAASWPDAAAPPATVAIAVRNVAFAGLMISALVATIGPLAGPIAWSIGVLAGYPAALKEHLTTWLPIGTTLHAQGLTARQAAWLTTIGILTIAIVWHRRAVPLRLAIRPAEDT